MPEAMRIFFSFSLRPKLEKINKISKFTFGVNPVILSEKKEKEVSADVKSDVLFSLCTDQLSIY